MKHTLTALKSRKRKLLFLLIDNDDQKNPDEILELLILKELQKIRKIERNWFIPETRLDLSSAAVDCKELFRMYAPDLVKVALWLGFPAVMRTAKNRYRVEGSEALAIYIEAVI
jgi:hypothetical protein